jgi:FK506-binding nuclear protein
MVSSNTRCFPHCSYDLLIFATANKKGKPFAFKVGKGEVIKGWDIGVVGMSIGGERRLTIPSRLAYGSRGMPGIPANSELTFDVKLLEIK